ncbi:MAG: enoyl-CoA hydratase/isomerase family protein [Bacteroidales bacterium]
MSSSKITNWDKRGNIGIISLSNGKENYLIEPEFLDLKDLKNWTNDNTLKGIVIRGAGRNFSAGASIDDLILMAKNESKLSEKISAGKEILDFIENLNIPVMASINGVCFGGGLEIALACHMRIASPNALFAFPETNLGLIPGLGGIYRIIQLLGQRDIYDLLLNAEMINAEKAYQLGLIDYITGSKDSSEEAIKKISNLIHDRSPELIHSVMNAIHNAKKLDRIEALKIETKLFCKLAIKVKKDQ